MLTRRTHFGAPEVACTPLHKVRNFVSYFRLTTVVNIGAACNSSFMKQTTLVYSSTEKTVYSLMTQSVHNMMLLRSNFGHLWVQCNHGCDEGSELSQLKNCLHTAQLVGWVASPRQVRLIPSSSPCRRPQAFSCLCSPRFSSWPRRAVLGRTLSRLSPAPRVLPRCFPVSPTPLFPGRQQYGQPSETRHRLQLSLMGRL